MQGKNIHRLWILLCDCWLYKTWPTIWHFIRTRSWPAKHAASMAHNPPAETADSRIHPLKVFQWNTLADGLAQFGGFHKVSQETLEWKSRAPLLLEEVLRANADIICLQEVNHFYDFFFPELRQHGYFGIFNSKYQSPAVKYGFSSDGCAIFLRESRLHLLSSQLFQYENVEGAPYNQGGIICHLEDREMKSNLILATTHLKASQGVENNLARVRQAEQLLNKLDLARTNDLPIIVCGDFNADPDSEVYQLMRKHRLGMQSIYALSCKCPSAYAKLPGLETLCNAACDGGHNSEPPFTTWKFRPSGEKRVTIDYIWCSKNTLLLPYRRWCLPTQACIGKNALPSSVIPSDHLPLICEFLWTAK